MPFHSDFMTAPIDCRSRWRVDSSRGRSIRAGTAFGYGDGGDVGEEGLADSLSALLRD